MVRFALTILLVGLALAPSARAIDDESIITRPGKEDGPTEVEIVLYILDLDRVDTQQQAIEANLFLAARWHDPRLAHGEEGVQVRPLVSVWNPGLQILSQQRAWKTFPENVTIEADGQVSYVQRLWGSFSQPLDLRDFPLDEQTFKLHLTAQGGEANVKLVPGDDPPSGIADTLSVTDWDVTGVSVQNEPISFVEGYRPTAGLSMTVSLKRRVGFFVAKVIAPLLLIVAMSWLVFWINPKELGVQINVAITTMLTLIAYRFAVGSSLPAVSYLTRLDYFILGSTVLVYLVLLEVIIVSTMVRRHKNVKLARKVDRICRWAFPSAFIIVALESLVLRIGI